MFHSVAFSSSIAGDGALHQLNQVADEVLPASNNGILVPPKYKGILLAMALGASLTRAQIVAPSLRNWGNQDLEPINKGSVFQSPPPKALYYPNILMLGPPEELDMYAAQNEGEAQTDYAFVLLSDGTFPTASGRMLQAHWTASATLTTGAWSVLQPVLDNPLAAGTYALVGAHFRSASALWGRIVPNGGDTSRPGGVATQTVNQLELDAQRQAGLGVWLTFTNYTVPNVEFFAISADTSEEGIFDLIPM